MSYIEENGYFVFDGIKSSDFGVWINGSGTYNAPARRFKEYVVPGRNGTLTMDEGSFEDIDLVYPAFIPRGFPSNIETFRNELLSRIGYLVLSDSYHPTEFYRARYMSGLETDVTPGGAAGSFNLKFRRDPRRFLVEGENTVSYPNGIADSINLLTYPYASTTKTSYGVTWTDNGDGTITTSGHRTSTSTNSFNVKNSSTPFTLPLGTYVLSGCPQGGGSNTYRITLQRYSGGSSTTVGYDTGNGLEFTVTSTTDEYRITLYMYQADANRITFRPMVQNKYGKNYIPYPYSDGASKTSYGVTYTATKGQVSCENTSTSNSSTFGVRTPSQINPLPIPAGTYKLSGCPVGGSSSTYYLRFSVGTNMYYDYGEGVEFTLASEAVDWSIAIYVRNGTDATGLVFTPELRSAIPALSGWTPYYDGTSAIYNPTLFESLPLIRVTGYGTLTINSDVITVSSGQTYVDIDSEIQDCYTGTTNKNSKVAFQSNKFPVLKPGANGISYTGSITKVEITPRWYRV